MVKADDAGPRAAMDCSGRATARPTATVGGLLDFGVATCRDRGHGAHFDDLVIEVQASEARRVRYWQYPYGYAVGLQQQLRCKT